VKSESDAGIGTTSATFTGLSLVVDGVGGPCPSPDATCCNLWHGNGRITDRLTTAPMVTGAYTNVPGASSPYPNTLIGSQKYYRLRLSL